MLNNRLMYIVLFILSQTGSFSQIVQINYVLNQKAVQVEPIDIEKLTFYQHMIKMDFNGHAIINESILKMLKHKTVYKVEFYYSNYKDSDEFSQRDLNQKRLENLKKKLPALFDNNAIDWVLMEQIETDKSKAINLFHGFILYTREPFFVAPDGTLEEITSEKEIELLKSKLEVDYYQVSVYHNQSIEVCDYVIVDSTDVVKRSSVHSGKYWPRSKRKQTKKIFYDKRSIWKRTPQMIKTTESNCKYVYEEKCWEEIYTVESSYGYTTDGYPVKGFVGGAVDDLIAFSLHRDTVVKKSFNQNKWNSPMVVEDVTGSMYPYLAQTFSWRRQNVSNSNVNNFAFFNDGDSKPDGPIGKSYGVYSIYSNDIDEIEEKAISAMRKGNGGGTPENDIEAMIRAVENSTKRIGELILIADNFSGVRDMSLLDVLLAKQIPISVIVCGSLKNRVNYQYIVIAYKSGGRLFTMDEEIDFKSTSKTDKTFTIGDQTFIIKNGHISLMDK